MLVIMVEIRSGLFPGKIINNKEEFNDTETIKTNRWKIVGELKPKLKIFKSF